MAVVHEYADRPGFHDNRTKVRGKMVSCQVTNEGENFLRKHRLSDGLVRRSVTHA